MPDLCELPCLVSPDFVYDPDGWEETYAWRDRDDLAEDQLDGPKEYATLIKGPPVWAAQIVLTRDENGEPNEIKTRWFASLEEAEAAVRNSY